MRSIMILGAGFMQGPAIRIAKKKGLKVYVADANPEAVCIKEADEFLNIDLKNKEALANAAANIANLAGVFTAGTDFSASVAWVAEKMRLPGISYDVALNASNKSRMRKVLKEAGVAIPAFASASIGSDPYKLAESLGVMPLVVKPVDSMGSRGCRLVRDIDELKEAWFAAIANSFSKQAIIEEYLEGPEFSLDALVYKGKIHISGIADRFVYFEPYFVEMGHTMPSSYNKEILDEVSEVFIKGIKALGIDNGAAKGDIKYTRKGAFVGEIAARLSGGYMSGWTYPYSSGIELTSQAIDIACGLEPNFSEQKLFLSASERAWISIPGKISSVHGLEKANRYNSVVNVFPRAEAGSIVVFPSNNVQKCGNIIAVADNQEKADAAAELAAKQILINLEPDNKDTIAFINKSTEWAWVRDAFSDLSAMTLASLSKLPDIIKRTDNISKAATVSIAPLRGIETEKALDWQGRSISEALEAVETLCGASTGMHGELVLGTMFWKAFLRAGYQGGVWAINRAKNEYIKA